jgi:putative transposase
VAIDRVPWPYFRREFAAEGLVKASGVGWSIVRATQFHQFIDAALTVAARLPVMVINPGVLAQPVDGREVADRFVDRIADAAAEPVLAAWGITTEGKPVFIGLDAAAGESDDAWDGFLRDLGERGLARPLLVISDGSAGLIGTAERTMPSALRQRCLVHRARNILAKVPSNAQAQVKADYWEIFEVPDKIAPGREGREVRAGPHRCLRPPLARLYPASVRCPHRPRLADRLPAVPPRALDPDPALQLHRAYLRRDPPPGQGHRPPARRAPLPVPGLGRPRPRFSRVARVHHDPRRLRLLHDLRRSLTQPPARLHRRAAPATAVTGTLPVVSGTGITARSGHRRG